MRALFFYKMICFSALNTSSKNKVVYCNLPKQPYTATCCIS